MDMAKHISKDLTYISSKVLLLFFYFLFFFEFHKVKGLVVSFTVQKQVTAKSAENQGFQIWFVLDHKLLIIAFSHEPQLNSLESITKAACSVLHLRSVNQFMTGISKSVCFLSPALLLFSPTCLLAEVGCPASIFNLLDR